jgi:hypothetical protein
MENNVEKVFTPEESLQLISQVITDTRMNFKYSSYFVLLWGWIVVIASLSCFAVIRYFMSTQQYTYINLGCLLAWCVPIAVGIAIQIVHIRRVNKIKRVKSQLGMIIRTLWLANFVAMVLSSFIASKLHFYPAPVTLMIVGMSTFVTGYIIRFKPLMYGATLFGVASVIAVYVPGDYQLIITAISIAFGYLVPGYMLKYSKN